MVNNVEQLLNLRRFAGVWCGDDRGDFRRDGARLLFRTQSRADVCPNRHHSDDCAIDGADDWCRLAEFGRLAHDFRLSGLLFAAALGFDVVFPAQAASKGKISMDVFGVVAGRFKRVLRTRAAMGYLFFQAFSFWFDVCLF